MALVRPCRLIQHQASQPAARGDLPPSLTHSALSCAWPDWLSLRRVSSLFFVPRGSLASSSFDSRSAGTGVMGWSGEAGGGAAAAWGGDGSSPWLLLLGGGGMGAAMEDSTAPPHSSGEDQHTRSRH